MSGELKTVREFELKMRVSSDFEVPDLAGLAWVAAVDQRPKVRMTAVYYDTADLRLVRWGVTLRRRVGGDDAGWHLKLPAGEGARDEIRLPLSAGEAGQVPVPLADLVTAICRSEPLVPVATLVTHREPVVLLDGEGTVIAELVDDRVSIKDGVEFRELEIEALSPDAVKRVRRLAAVLVDEGAEPGSLPKVATALGDRVGEPPDVAPLKTPRAKDPAGDAVRAHLAEHVRSFMDEDIRVRRNLPDAVHQMRVAARQLRSGLKSFGPLVDRAWAHHLRKELGGATERLGALRDTEVLLERLRTDAESLPAQQATRAGTAVEWALRDRMVKAQPAALAELRSQRYLELLDALVDAVHHPRLQPDAERPCRKVLPGLVDDAWDKLAKRVRQLELNGPDVDWHQARIKAKQARYVAESAAPITNRGAHRLSVALGRVTDVLGAEHDAAVAQDELAGLAARAEVNGATGYALGQLAAVERESQLAQRRRFDKVWRAAQKAHHKFGR